MHWYRFERYNGSKDSNSLKENYDGKHVCQTQDDFNVAFQKAVEANNQTMMNETKPWIITMAVVYLIFVLWAILLALQIQPQSDRTLHIVFALLFSPQYVIAHYMGLLGGR